MILRVLGSALVIALLVAGWYLLNNEQEEGPAASPAGNSAANPGYSAQNAVLIETAPDGRPMYTLHAASIRQEPESAITTLHEVQMQFRDQKGNLWNGRADIGRVIEQATRVELMGNVTVTGRVPGTREPLKISSNRLNVDTHTAIVTTDDPVVLDWNGQVVHARGLIAHLKEQRVRLESNVHGIYLP